jgi:putative endonuclease
MTLAYARLMTSKRMIGTVFEDQAVDFLESKGFRILQRNVNFRWGEIDLVAHDQERNELVFVEVRARKHGGMQAAEETISYGKLRRLHRAIASYLVSDAFLCSGINAKGARIDLIAFEGNRCAHWPNFV